MEQLSREQQKKLNQLKITKVLSIILQVIEAIISVVLVINLFLETFNLLNQVNLKSGFLLFLIFVLICILVVALNIILFSKLVGRYKYIVAAVLCITIGFLLYHTEDTLLIYSVVFLVLGIVNAIGNYIITN